MNVSIRKTVALILLCLAKLHSYCINADDNVVLPCTASDEWQNEVNGAVPMVETEYSDSSGGSTEQEEAMRILLRCLYHLGVCICDGRYHCCGLVLCSLHTMHQMHQFQCSDAAAMIEGVDGNLLFPKNTTDTMVDRLRRQLEFARHEQVFWQVTRGAAVDDWSRRLKQTMHRTIMLQQQHRCRLHPSHLRPVHYVPTYL